MIEGLSALGTLSPSSSVGAPASSAAPAEGVSFEEALGQAIGSAVDTLQTGEAFAIQGVQGAATPMVSRPSASPATPRSAFFSKAISRRRTSIQ